MGLSLAHVEQIHKKHHSRFLHSRKIYFRPRRGDVFLAGWLLGLINVYFNFHRTIFGPYTRLMVLLCVCWCNFHPLIVPSFIFFSCRATSGANGIFSRRLDFSSFNVLPRQRINSYSIKVSVWSCAFWRKKPVRGEDGDGRREDGW